MGLPAAYYLIAAALLLAARTDPDLLIVARGGGSLVASVYRDGRIQTERGAKRVRSFPVGSKQLQGVSVGSSEHFTLPRVAPRLREVNAYLGWFGPLSRPMQAASLAGSVAFLLSDDATYITGEILSIDFTAGHQDGTPFPALCVGLE